MKRDVLTDTVDSNIMRANIIKKEISGFFILDDGTPIKECSKIVEYIKGKGYDVHICSLESITEDIYKSMMNSELFSGDYCMVGLGDGGSRILRYLKPYIAPNVSCYELEWSRLWKDGFGYGFKNNADEFSWKDKKIVIVEDVIASGETLLNAIQCLEGMGAKVRGVISTIISEYSPLIKSDKLPYTTIGVCVCNQKPVNEDEKSKAHWFPPIYSLRHLLYGENEMPDFYEKLSEIYFDGDSDIREMFYEARL